MGFSRKILSGVLGTALLATSATPAFAGGFGSIGVGSGWGNSWGGVSVGSSWGGHRGWGRRHHRGDNDTGEVLAGVLIGAVLTGAILSSKNKKRQRSEPTVDYPRDRNGDYDREDPRNNRAPQDRQGSISSENLAVDACASEAESRAGRASSVRDITQVRSTSNGWDVEGVVESRDGYRDRATDRRSFTCSVRMGSIDSFYLEDGRVAMR